MACYTTVPLVTRPLARPPAHPLVHLHAQSMDRARATLIVSTLSVVLASILAVGALTKPLFGGVLRDGDDAAIVAQLDRVPLLG